MLNRPSTLHPRLDRGLILIRDLLIHPADFFRSVAAEPAGSILKYYLIALAAYTGLVTALASTGLVVTVPPGWLELVLGIPTVYPSAYFFPVWLVLAIGCSLGRVVILTLIPELTLRAVYGREFSKGIGQTFKAVAVSFLPFLLFGWIPFVGILASLYVPVVEIIGLRELHGISTGKAIVAVFLLAIVIFMLLAGILIYLYMMGYV